MVLEMVFGQDYLGAAEAIRFYDVGAGFKIGLVDAFDDVGTRDYEVLVAAFEHSSAEVVRRKVGLLEHGAHGAVDYEYAGVESVV
jgi:hypothetical protein